MSHSFSRCGTTLSEFQRKQKIIFSRSVGPRSEKTEGWGEVERRAKLAGNLSGELYPQPFTPPPPPPPPLTGIQTTFVASLSWALIWTNAECFVFLSSVAFFLWSYYMQAYTQRKCVFCECVCVCSLALWSRAEERNTSFPISEIFKALVFMYLL